MTHSLIGRITVLYSIDHKKKSGHNLAKILAVALWKAMPCQLVNSNQCFEEASCHNLWGSAVQEELSTRFIFHK
jgi:hypothetical protein